MGSNRHAAASVGISVLLILVGGLGRGSNAEPAQPTPAVVDHFGFDQLLRANVRDERVDYLNLRKSHLADLSAYLDRMADIDPATLPRAEALAYWLNLYNAAVIQAIAERMDRDFTVVAGNAALFKEKRIRTKGGLISLDQIENEIVRPKFKDPRIHAGFVCGAVSCPPLLPRAFTGADLEKTLDENMKAFVNDPGRNTADHTTKTIALSKLFEWYAGDFGGSNGVLAYVDRYHPNDLKGYQVTYKEYDWSVNFAPPNGTRWIAIIVDRSDVYAAPASDTVVGRVERLKIYEVIETQNAWHRIVLPDGTKGWVPDEVTEDFSG